MKLWVFSDIHQEHWDEDRVELEKPDGIDMIVALGDIDNQTKGIDWLDQYKTPTIYVPGNHEYYTRQFSKLNKKFEKTQGLVMPCTRRHVQVDDVHFLATTLWADCMADDWFSRQAIQKGVSNFYVTWNGDRTLSVDDVVVLFNANKHWLNTELEILREKGELNKTVICTHFAPSIQSSPLEYKNSSIRGFFSSNLEDMILKYQPKYWLHGHMHNVSDYMIDNTRVICNPLGYPSETKSNTDFNKELVIEI